MSIFEKVLALCPSVAVEHVRRRDASCAYPRQWETHIDAMPAESPAAPELTRRIIARLRGSDDEPGAAAAAARDACDCVSAEFSRWVGARGYEALISRALAEVRPTHSALETIRYGANSELRLTGVAESVERHGADATARALVMLIETILALCTRLIGDDIVATLVEKSMENITLNDAGRRHTLDQRGARP
ncbi:MAG TPA: hypothetical protein VM033_03195 [Gemmatimonadaceae bacterium]|nr:hypothetical protein [Gemmatimonadaceae bacterium]